MELLALIRSFGEQIRLVSFIEPKFIQVQDLLDKPFFHRDLSQKSKFLNRLRSSCWDQIRILDLEKCISKTKLNCKNISFNLKLTDPIENYLDKDSKWKGVAGDYIVTFGKKSNAVAGFDEKLLTMKASVGAFSRLWFGVRNATALSLTDDLIAPKELLELLDEKLQIPIPQYDWGF